MEQHEDKAGVGTLYFAMCNYTRARMLQEGLPNYLGGLPAGGCGMASGPIGLDRSTQCHGNCMQRSNNLEPCSLSSTSGLHARGSGPKARGSGGVSRLELNPPDLFKGAPVLSALDSHRL